MRNRNGMLQQVVRNQALTLAAAAVVLGTLAAPSMAEFKLKVPTSLNLNGSTPVLAANSGVASVAASANGADAYVRTPASSDATSYAWNNAAGGNFSTATNWTPNGVPVAGDNVAFNASPAGNYSVTDDIAATLGDYTETRGALAPTVTVNGGFRGNRMQVTNGGLVLNGGSTVVNSEYNDTVNNTSLFYGFRIGIGDGATANSGLGGALTIQGGATVSYHDFLSGSAGGVGTVVITGAGTALVPVLSDAVRADFRGGGLGTSNTTITAGASVTANYVLENNYATTNISNGGSLTALSYNSTDPTSGAVTRYGGQIEVGVWDGTSGATPPTSVYNVNNGTVNTTFFNVARGDYRTSTVTVSNGGKITGNEMDVATSVGSIANISITGTGSAINLGEGLLDAGGTATDTGAGSTNMSITAGGSYSGGQARFGSLTAVSSGANYTGSSLVVDGAGSKFSLGGIAAADTTSGTAAGGNLLVGNGTGLKSTITVSNGGLIDLLSTSTDGNQNGALVMGEGNNSVSTLTVDGAGSIFNSGDFAEIMQGDTLNGFLGAKATINVTNGGQFRTSTDADGTGGNIQFGVTFSGGGASITVNVGGGTGASDNQSSLTAGGVLFVGGSGTADAPTVGVPTTVTVNNGLVQGDAVLIYAGSTVIVNKGELAGGLVLARGGTVKLSPTLGAGAAILEAGQFAADNGGSFDIGKSGGISYLSDTSDTDLADVKALIVAGLSSTSNSIYSSALAANPKLAIGYALRPANDARTSFLGVTFAAADSAVLFRVTLKGDANLTGSVNFSDLVILAQNYNGTGREWYQGDFNYDGVVNFNDLVVLAQNYNGVLVDGALASDLGGTGFASDWLLANSLAPEPTTLGLAMAAGAIVARRRRR